MLCAYLGQNAACRGSRSCPSIGGWVGQLEPNGSPSFTSTPRLALTDLGLAVEIIEAETYPRYPCPLLFPTRIFLPRLVAQFRCVFCLFICLYIFRGSASLSFLYSVFLDCGPQV